ncbi:hypothetical protein HOLleu_19653 [Holothuria leucospilota]|uniref:Uncharacterized protein n=1 Tax=Holothuria leucospilota TaxID=206669 RepID=A0A9Q1H7T5_HOLLE|nr:hypothetical protein HOLleu_19653 [Holothuria leucospilota]
MNYQRSKSKISQEFPRLSSGVTGVKSNIFPRISKIAIWGYQRSKSKISQDRHLGSSRVKKQNFPRIPKIVMGSPEVKSKYSQDNHQESPEVKQHNIPSIPKIVIWGHQRSKSKLSQEFSRSKIHWSRIPFKTLQIFFGYISLYTQG